MVKATYILVDDISSFNQTLFRFNLAAYAGVPLSNVVVERISSASIRVDVVIIMPDEAAANTVSSTLRSVNDTMLQSLSEELGFTVEGVESVGIEFRPLEDPDKPTSEALSASEAANVPAIAGSVAGAFVLVIIAVAVVRKRRNSPTQGQSGTKGTTSASVYVGLTREQVFVDGVGCMTTKSAKALGKLPKAGSIAPAQGNESKRALPYVSSGAAGANHVSSAAQASVNRFAAETGHVSYSSQL